ncbi:MAG: glycosyltransferase family 2 protein, partial [Flavicella sp.]
MKIAVVVLNWNGKKLLENFLPSLVAFSKEATVYVADNASTDDSVPFILEYFPSVKIIQNKKNGGYAKGYNDALQKIKADVYALVNSDIEVTENWLSPIIETFDSSKDIGIIQPKILDYNNKNRFEYAGAAGGFLDMLGYPFCRGRIFQSLENDTQQYNDNIAIDWASGACLFIRSKIYHELEGFDEDFFAHMEEIDLCWRLKNRGYRIGACGGSVVYHLGGGTLQKISPFKSYLNFRNNLYMLVKNH